MKLVIHGKNIEITDAIREYVHQKIEKAVSHFQNITNQVDVHLSVARNPRISTKQAAEVTIYANGSVIRAEESSESLYASIDLVADKIARQLLLNSLKIGFLLNIFLMFPEKADIY